MYNRPYTFNTFYDVNGSRADYIAKIFFKNGEVSQQYYLQSEDSLISSKGKLSVKG